MQAGLRAAVPAARKARILSWPQLRPSGGWMQSARARSAAAAAIVAVVVGGGWIVSSRLPASQSATAVALPAHYRRTRRLFQRRSHAHPADA